MTSSAVSELHDDCHRFASLLRDVAQFPPPERLRQSLTRVAEQPALWSRFLRAAEFEAVDASVAYHGLSLDLPAAARRTLEALRDQLIYRDTLHLLLRQRVLVALATGGVNTLLLKGSDLSQRLYPERWVRPMSDIDILIPPAQRMRADAIVRGLGLRRHAVFPTRPGKEALYFEWAYLAEPIPGYQLLLELHVNIANPARVNVDTTAIWRESEPWVCDGVPTRRLGETDLFCHLMMHLAAHFYMLPLRALADMHLLASERVLAWDDVVARMTRWGATRFAYYALRMVMGTFGTEVPAPVLASLRPPAPLRWWVERWLPRCVPPTPRAATMPRSPQLMLYFPLLDTHRQRLRTVVQEVHAHLLDRRRTPLPG